MCQNLQVWFGRLIFDTILVISWDSVHIFQNQFLRWNRESEPVDLNTMNPIIRTIFFLNYKGARCQFKLKKRQGRWHPMIKKFIFLKSTQKIHPGFIWDKVRKELFCFLNNPIVTLCSDKFHIPRWSHRLAPIELSSFSCISECVTPSWFWFLWKFEFNFFYPHPPLLGVLKQAQLGVPHSRIQVELGFILQAWTCQILNFA